MSLNLLKGTNSPERDSAESRVVTPPAIILLVFLTQFVAFQPLMTLPERRKRKRTVKKSQEQT